MHREMNAASMPLGRAPRFLLLDPDAIALRTLRQRVRERHPKWEIVVEQSAEQALTLLQARDFDVLLTEIVLGAMPGVELLRLARECAPRTVRLVHAARTRTRNVLCGAGLAYRVLDKPAENSALMPAITSALRMRHELSRARSGTWVK